MKIGINSSLGNFSGTAFLLFVVFLFAWLVKPAIKIDAASSAQRPRRQKRFSETQSRATTSCLSRSCLYCDFFPCFALLHMVALSQIHFRCATGNLPWQQPMSKEKCHIVKRYCSPTSHHETQSAIDTHSGRNARHAVTTLSSSRPHKELAEISRLDLGRRLRPHLAEFNPWAITVFLIRSIYCNERFHRRNRRMPL
jgi:hypothetical protein